MRKSDKGEINVYSNNHGQTDHKQNTFKSVFKDKHKSKDTCCAAEQSGKQQFKVADGIIRIAIFFGVFLKFKHQDSVKVDCDKIHGDKYINKNGADHTTVVCVNKK